MVLPEFFMGTDSTGAGFLDALCQAWHGLDAHDLASTLSGILHCTHAYAMPSASAPSPTNQSSSTLCEKGRRDVRVRPAQGFRGSVEESRGAECRP